MPCPANWHYSASLGRCYYLMVTPEPWFNMLIQCMFFMGADMLNVGSQEEKDFVRSESI